MFAWIFFWRRQQSPNDEAAEHGAYEALVAGAERIGMSEERGNELDSRSKEAKALTVVRSSATRGVAPQYIEADSAAKAVFVRGVAHSMIARSAVAAGMQSEDDTGYLPDEGHESDLPQGRARELEGKRLDSAVKQSAVQLRQFINSPCTGPEHRTIRYSDAEDDAASQAAGALGSGRTARAQKGARQRLRAIECGEDDLHFLPGYAPDLNPDELVWSHVKRTGAAPQPLQQDERVNERIAAELLAVQHYRPLLRSCFRTPSVSDFTDC